MAENTSVLVEILQGTQVVSGGCNCSSCGSAASCGSNVDYEKATGELAEQLKKTYGDKVEVKYVDVDKAGIGNYPIVDRVLQMGYPYPITLINGDPKFAGGIMEREIKSNIDEILKPEN
ncbi:MAG: hypothetical protein ABFD08_07640 [Syntrophomonas sp.]